MIKEKLTIVRVCRNNFRPSSDDIERWSKIFSTAENREHNKEFIENAILNGEITVEEFNRREFAPEYSKHIMLVKVGDENYLPTSEDLDEWRRIIDAMKDDPDFTIITWPGVSIELIPFEDVKILAVETDGRDNISK